jgi:NAD(P)-dependent dehydrogenase (short-subunit alcohol dehydrogenase family)
MAGQSRSFAAPGNMSFHDSMGAPPDLFAKDVPLGRYGAPEEVAEVFALLVSGRGNWLPRGNIHVDGRKSPR